MDCTLKFGSLSADELSLSRSSARSKKQDLIRRERADEPNAENGAQECLGEDIRS